MNRRHLIPSLLTLSVLTFALSAFACAKQRAADVDIDIVNAGGQSFPLYPTGSEARDVYRAYLEARNKEPYRIRVRNHSGRRVGLVIAVDGRNIISGARSDLERSERMYILDPWQSGEYEGWRSSRDRVNEFYFTEWTDSYAAAFGDRSARGVIAVAVYREREQPKLLQRYDERETPKESGKREPGAAAPEARDESARARSQPGTGYGTEVYSPAQLVAFDPERNAASRHFIKYEWRDALCRRGVIDCGDREPNRFWDENDRYGYAPPPPKRRW